MKYVYQVKERLFLEGEARTPYSGIRFYSSKAKAQEDFNLRIQEYAQGIEPVYQDEYGTTYYTKEIIFKKGNMLHEVILEKHEVY